MNATSRSVLRCWGISCVFSYLFPLDETGIDLTVAQHQECSWRQCPETTAELQCGGGLSPWMTILSKGCLMTWIAHFIAVQFSSVTQSCPTLHDPMDCSMPGFPVHHHLPELPQTHGHRVSDAIQPSRPLSSPSPPALNLSQHHGLFQWIGSSHQVAKVLEVQHQSFQWILKVDFI